MDTRPVHLNELLRLSFTGPYTWLSGNGREDSPIKWIVASIDELQSGDILVAQGDLFNSDLLRCARQAGAAAAILLGEPPSPQETLPTDFPVAVVSEPNLDLREALRSLLTSLINFRAALLERGIRIHNQLSKLQAEGGGLNGLARAIGDISGRGVLIQDKRGIILAEYASSSLLTIWDDILAGLHGMERMPASLTDRKRAGQHQAVIRQEIPGGLERVISPISVGEVARGYLSLVGIQGELDELDHLVIEQGVSICAVEMARSKAIREAEKRLKGDLLTALLKDTLSPREGRLWVESMGLDPDQAHVAMRFAWDGASRPSRRRLETLINGEISHRRFKAIVSPMGSEVVCICQEDCDSKRPENALDLGKSVLDQAAKEYPESQGRCGIGTLAGSMEDWRSSMQRAGQALDLARRLGERAPLYYADLSVYRLLLQLEHSPELIAFQEETIGPLLAHESSSELIQTLEAYFESNGNLSQAAEALFIHRNTLIYRLERLTRIMHLDLNEQENRLAIQLALRIHRMTKGHRDQSSR